jgi:predicted transcriptional regulator
MKLTPAEWKLMNAVWKSHPVTARGVAERLQDDHGWAYTTIKTMLTRLVSKGALAERKEGKTSLYEPLVSRRKARAKAIGALAADAFDGAFGSLMHFLVEGEELSPSERRKLMALLKEGGQKGEAKR